MFLDETYDGAGMVWNILWEIVLGGLLAKISSVPQFLTHDIGNWTSALSRESSQLWLGVYELLSIG